MLVNPKALLEPAERLPFETAYVKVTDGAFLGHFNSDFDLWQKNDFDRSHFKLGSLNSYGVCDTPQQFLDEYGSLLADDPRPLVVVFTHIPKNPGEPLGWRWHKWGPYVGHGQPTTEYLDDEAEFDEGVYVYHFYIVDNIPLETSGANSD